MDKVLKCRVPFSSKGFHHAKQNMLLNVLFSHKRVSTMPCYIWYVLSWIVPFGSKGVSTMPCYIWYVLSWLVPFGNVSMPCTHKQWQ